MKFLYTKSDSNREKWLIKFIKIAILKLQMETIFGYNLEADCPIFPKFFMTMQNARVYDSGM